MAGFLRRALGGRRARASAAADPTTPSVTAGRHAAQPTAVQSAASQPTVVQPAATQPTATAAPTAAGPAGQARAGVATSPSATAGSPSRLLIFGQVKQGEDGPLVGATVTLTDLSGRQLDRDSADAGGHYRLSPPAGGSYLVICASAAHQPTAALVAVADAPVRHDVLLSGAGADLSGTVRLAESGEPLADAVVTLVDIHGDVTGARWTDPQGRFRFVELAAGAYTVTVAAAGLAPVARGVQIPTEGLVEMVVDVAARVQLTGVVRTATAGVVVPEALATLITADGQVVASAVTDATGGFVFDDLPVGVYTLIASGYPPVAAEVTVGMGASTETVVTLWPPTLDPPGTVGAGDGAGDTGGDDTRRDDAQSNTDAHSNTAATPDNAGDVARDDTGGAEGGSAEGDDTGSAGGKDGGDGH